MHTQTASASEQRYPTATRLHAARGIGLYLATLGAEGVLGAGVRWLLTYLGASALGAVLPLGLAAEQLALAAAFGPLLISALALAHPGSGLIFSRRIGARRPSEEERERIEQALGLLGTAERELPECPSVYILDDPFPAAAARGRSIVLHRGLFDTDALAPVLAHELGHVRSLDGPLTESLARLRLWGAPSPPEPSDAASQRPPESLLGQLARAIARLGAGGVAARLLSPLWAAHWRSREYAADAYAAALGQGPDLAAHLGDFELALDLSQRRFPFELAEHPPVALRIERLQGAGFH